MVRQRLQVPLVQAAADLERQPPRFSSSLAAWTMPTCSQAACIRSSWLRRTTSVASPAATRDRGSRLASVNQPVSPGAHDGSSRASLRRAAGPSRASRRLPCCPRSRPGCRALAAGRCEAVGRHRRASLDRGSERAARRPSRWSPPAGRPRSRQLRPGVTDVHLREPHGRRAGEGSRPRQLLEIADRAGGELPMEVDRQRQVRRAVEIPGRGGLHGYAAFRRGCASPVSPRRTPTSNAGTRQTT